MFWLIGVLIQAGVWAARIANMTQKIVQAFQTMAKMKEAIALQAKVATQVAKTVGQSMSEGHHAHTSAADRMYDIPPVVVFFFKKMFERGLVVERGTLKFREGLSQGKIDELKNDLMRFIQTISPQELEAIDRANMMMEKEARERAERCKHNMKQWLDCDGNNIFAKRTQERSKWVWENQQRQERQREKEKADTTDQMRKEGKSEGEIKNYWQEREVEKAYLDMCNRMGGYDTCKKLDPRLWGRIQDRKLGPKAAMIGWKPGQPTSYEATKGVQQDRMKAYCGEMSSLRGAPHHLLNGDVHKAQRECSPAGLWPDSIPEDPKEIERMARLTPDSRDCKKYANLLTMTLSPTLTTRAALAYVENLKKACGPEGEAPQDDQRPPPENVALFCRRNSMFRGMKSNPGRNESGQKHFKYVQRVCADVWGSREVDAGALCVDEDGGAGGECVPYAYGPGAAADVDAPDAALAFDDDLAAPPEDAAGDEAGLGLEGLWAEGHPAPALL